MTHSTRTPALRQHLVACYVFPTYAEAEAKARTLNGARPPVRLTRTAVGSWELRVFVDTQRHPANRDTDRQGRWGSGRGIY